MPWLQPPTQPTALQSFPLYVAAADKSGAAAGGTMTGMAEAQLVLQLSLDCKWLQWEHLH
jgi:hypothetical protein